MASIWFAKGIIMGMLKITSLALFTALGISIGAVPGFASQGFVKTKVSLGSNSYETAHLKKKRKHRHCHTSYINQKLVKTCHRHRHWILHHIRKS